MVAKKIFQFVLFSVFIFLLSTDVTYSRSWFDLRKPDKKECKIDLEPSQFQKSSPVRFVFKTKANGTLVFSAEGSEEFTELQLVIGDSRRLFTPIIRANIVGMVESPEWQNLFKHFPIYLTAKTHSDNYTSSVYQRIEPLDILKTMERKCGLFIEDISLIKHKRWNAEQNLNLNNLEKKFIIWALKRHFKSWEYSIPVYPEFNSEIREKLKPFSSEQGLSPSRFVSSAVINKLKEKTGFSILPQYEDARLFCKGVAAVKKNGQWGLIDTENNWVLSPTYQNVGWCQEGYLPVMRNDLWGIINHKGVLVQSIRYQKILDCSEQRCAVKLDDKWGYVIPNGWMIIRPQYDTVNKFREGYAAVKKGNKWLLINRYNKAQYRLSAKKLYSPSEGLSTFQDNNNKRGFINIHGKIVIPSQFQGVRMFSEGLAAVYNGKKWGFIDSRGKMKISFDFENVKGFRQKIAPVKGASGKWGYIDKNGDLVISHRFKYGFQFDNNGIAVVRVENPTGENPYRGFIKKNGSFYYEPIFEDVYQFQEGLAPVKLFGHWGFISK
ncbi:hypothetical protein PN36_28660 [Candidatus Thiomargarita nelsonii]|uniref:WG repeat-containing protein n=1 Tax=Candidatus Thiomargarita nelsonii TaxID=1003181 RepID=A0A0A6P1T9_9GAMM|nr:hypothetical protein PN36_28660 [Candidatus Thiomargarita nelsonii]